MLNILKVWFPGVNLWSAPKISKKQIISFRVDPLSANIRFYNNKIVDSDSNICDEHTEWYKIITVQYTDIGDIYISGVKEGLLRKEYKLLFSYFKSKKYRSVYYRHKHKEFFCDLTKEKFNLLTL